MRILAIISTLLFFAFGTTLVAQGPRQTGPGGFGQGGATPPPWMQGNNPQQQNQMGRPVPGQAQGQGNQTATNQTGTLNPNQVTQIMARLRAMDANGNGSLEANEIPANQRDRVNTMITQLGGNPNAPQINLANLERRAQNNAQNNARQANNNNNRQQQNDNQQGRQQRQQQVVEPLVRPFGETRPAERPVLGFGQRDAAPQNSPGNREGGREGGRQREMAMTQANQQNAAAAARDTNTVRLSAVYDGIPANVRSNSNFSWFFDYDTDQDGQLTMVEYINGRGGGVWTNDFAAEFLNLDRNGDGLITVEEALTTIREWDVQREQAEAEQAAVRQQGEARGNNQPPGPGASASGSGPPVTPSRVQGNNRPTAVAPTAPGRSQNNQMNSAPNSGRGGTGPAGRRGA